MSMTSALLPTPGWPRTVQIFSWSQIIVNLQGSTGPCHRHVQAQCKLDPANLAWMCSLKHRRDPIAATGVWGIFQHQPLLIWLRACSLLGPCSACSTEKQGAATPSREPAKPAGFDERRSGEAPQGPGPHRMIWSRDHLTSSLVTERHLYTILT
jgi:hypothetical protein